MNVLLVGLGRWGEKHLRVLARAGRHRLGGRRARRAPAMGGGARASTPERIGRRLSRRPAARGRGRTSSRRPTAIGRSREACLAAGRHCFVEKPLATLGRRRPSSRPRPPRAAGRVLQVGHIFRFHPVTATLRAALDGRTDRRACASRPAASRASSARAPTSGVTHTDAIHYFDLFAHLLGREATRVSAVQRDFLGRGLDDMSRDASCTTATSRSIVEANYFVPGTRRECVHRRRARQRSSPTSARRHRHASSRRASAAAAGLGGGRRPGRKSCRRPDAEPLRLELEAFLDACPGQGVNPVPAEAGVQALEIVEAAARAARLQRTVAIGEVR